MPITCTSPSAAAIKGSYDYSVFADAKQSVVFRFKREIPDDPATPGIWVPIPDEYADRLPARLSQHLGRHRARLRL